MNSNAITWIMQSKRALIIQPFFSFLYYSPHAIAHPSHLFYFQPITFSSCKRYAFTPQKGCYYVLKAVRL